ncbi:hypothetical protein NO559_04810 [Dasania sp. GY-MA-18]|uniref:Uncharacterized protein n=1 Tax=Dasania phycosphaerae TaxID=2950436 RepID=A0A9J6RJ69_9GAMM|nr:MULTISPECIES: hypothetical protein [Dasania]MCR8922079.1 hypothetical protein [Dasania sp. GY-MA-18]MCZ0864507.1 hypothetical protein [Dasania phycosphaerae]MCZ0868235.1 hypothetical protein [Dasania phycosphaerae]
MESETLSLTAIIGTIGAVLTVLIKLFDMISSWKKTRDKDKQVNKEIDHTLKEIEFINGWLAAVGKANSDADNQQRQTIALKRLDQLMQSYQQYCRGEKQAPPQLQAQKGNGWFYAISIFMLLAVMGLFVDDNDDWSLQAFQHNMDSDAAIGLAFFLMIWVYFFINSRFFKRVSP